MLNAANPRVQPFNHLSLSLIKGGHVTNREAIRAEKKARLSGLRLADVFCRCNAVSQLTIATILAESVGAQLINPAEELPDFTLLRKFGATTCLRHGLLPWRQIGGDIVVLTTRPDQFDRYRPALIGQFGKVRMAVTTEDQLNRCVSQHCGQSLALAAETRTPAVESCRHWNKAAARICGMIALSALLFSGVFYTQTLFAVLTAWAITVLFFNTTLKATAAFIGWRNTLKPPQTVSLVRLPVITMLVPLYNETAIADHLLARLKALDYPRELLDVCLILEEDDLTTRAALGKTILPTWMRPVIVPHGTIKTKPRAMNYALDFAHGSIIGIWDAEDAPEPDQLHKVAKSFANCGPKVACLQGKLDYYNASKNWLTRCFAIEYASWFRVLLPGMSKLELVIPLGGTTLFFRRDTLEKLGGWDAHNVTEDADLGMRLARHGYRTELIDTVTEEEANGRTWPWIKQRSRWLKGYAVTYRVHMRNPIQLLRDLGLWRFFGFQLLFLGTLTQFVLAPVLWTFWLLPFGFAHPLDALIPSWAFWTLAGLFVTSELVGFAAAVIGVGKAGKSWLGKWALTLQFYFPLAAIAAYKGLYELATKPFYWDKTAHGVLLPDDWDAPVSPPPQPPAHPVLAG